MVVYHQMTMKFKPDVSPEQIAEVGDTIMGILSGVLGHDPVPFRPLGQAAYEASIFSTLGSPCSYLVIQVIETSLAMKDACIHSETNKPYIKSITGGKNLFVVPNKPGFTHTLLYEFETIEDCKFFIEKDVKHHEARRFRGRIEDAVLLHWSPDEF
ncbi:uncharacterized protein Z518_03504 [Rhinocladiella mackenziei CBS 650.93]|uniref:Rhinocladiella mackenziei CBS 650.93 unplaced genomic scaffold supercont1.2, whole genome shotgun sequence n=1 Tax=Rhinocladiella mackenziei CBS 650.93 TaxID=1442369 RepID=A0A0D2G2S0_9EURO|nr:uncharacterized protein Z518_03504 [Rhinocladiella mackenziei CBS 650.93]KIX08847.1 hypothetical protein Z518_03504 [Rhinocladiella mackenziei CBS 650.93]